jgi:hypothetical protein
MSEIEEEPTKHLKGKYRIAICQDGRFTVTFDTGKKKIRYIKK